MPEPHGLRRGGKPARLLRHLYLCEAARMGLTEADTPIFEAGAVVRLTELGYVTPALNLTEQGRNVAQSLI